MDRDGNAGQLRGKWRIVGDTICATFPLAMESGEHCYHVYQLADGSNQSWTIPDGKLRTSFRIRPQK